MNLNLDRLLEHSRDRRRLPEPAFRRLIREKAGLSQSELAAVVGVSRPTLTRWEAGTRTPGRRHLACYLTVLDRLVDETVIDDR